MHRIGPFDDRAEPVPGRERINPHLGVLGGGADVLPACQAVTSTPEATWKHVPTGLLSPSRTRPPTDPGHPPVRHPRPGHGAPTSGPAGSGSAAVGVGGAAADRDTTS